jgi:hypothetical protein
MDKKISEILKTLGIDQSSIKDMKIIDINELISESLKAQEITHSIRVTRSIGWRISTSFSNSSDIKDGECFAYGYRKPFTIKRVSFGVEFVTQPYKSCVIGLGWIYILIALPREVDCFIIEDVSEINKRLISQISKEFFNEYDKCRRIEAFTRRMLRQRLRHTSRFGRFCFHWNLESRKWKKLLRSIWRNTRMLCSAFFRV